MDIIPELKAELFAYSYEKIWEEMTEADRFLVSLLTERDEYKREEVLKLMGGQSGNYSVYRDRLIKRGILAARQGYISLALPFLQITLRNIVKNNSKEINSHYRKKKNRLTDVFKRRLV